MLKILAVALFGLTWLAAGIMAKKYGPAGDNASDTSQAGWGQATCFQLWEFHPDNSLRLVEVFVEPGTANTSRPAGLPLLRPGDEVLSLDFIGGELDSRQESDETYNGVTYRKSTLSLQTTADEYGFIARIAHPPHLHLDGQERLISIGFDPSPGWKQLLIVVAVPASAQGLRITDYEPYKTLEWGAWKLFYYDVTEIQDHVSIHIRYTPGSDASPLDWEAVREYR